MKKEIIATSEAPRAIGPYSQAVKVDHIVYLSGQIPLVPETMTVIDGGIKAQIKQTFENLQAVVKASGGTFDNIVKLNIYMCDLAHFSLVNEMMSAYFSEPYPARAAIEVSALPKGVAFEVDGIMHL